MRHVRGLWPSCISRVMVDMYSRIGALKSWCFNSAFAEDLTLLGLAWGWMLGRGPTVASETQPWVNLRATQAAWKEDGL